MVDKKDATLSDSALPPVVDGITAARTWFFFVYPISPVMKNDPEEHELEVLEEIYSILRERYNVSEFYFSSQMAAPYDETFGGIRHIQRLEDKMVELAFNLYSELCVNVHSMKEIHVIAAGSGVYLALRLVHFFVKYGDEYRYDMHKFDCKWAKILASTEIYEGSNHRAKLFRQFIFLSPSLPSPRGLAKLLWSFIKPPFYDYSRLKQTIGKTILVGVEERTDYFQRVDVVGLDVERTTWSMLKYELPKMFLAAPLESDMSDASTSNIDFSPQPSVVQMKVGELEPFGLYVPPKDPFSGYIDILYDYESLSNSTSMEDDD